MGSMSVSQGGQLGQELLEAHLRRVDGIQMASAFCSSVSRAFAMSTAKNIVIDARFLCRAVIAGTGVSTDIVAERFKAGESADEAGIRLRVTAQRLKSHPLRTSLGESA